MFIRVKTKPGNPKKVDQRIVRHIGVAATEAELEKLMEFGEIIMVEVRCERQPSLVAQKKLVDLAVEIRREKAKEGPPVVIESIREERPAPSADHPFPARLSAAARGGRERRPALRRFGRARVSPRSALRKSPDRFLEPLRYRIEKVVAMVGS